MKKFITVLCILLTLLSVVAIPAGAAKAYQTYTYSIGGEALYSPDAYTAEKSINSVGMGLQTLNNAGVAQGTGLNGSSDMVVDAAGNVYIADSENNRIVCLDRYYRVRFEIKTFLNEQKIEDTFSKPQGVFVTEDRYEGDELRYKGRIFVCDTQNSRIVAFNLDGTFESVIPAPESELFSEDAVYWPVAMAVDAYDRLYVVSTETNEGIIVMTDKGVFTSFIGAQQSVTSVWDQIWKRFQSAEQRKRAEQVISYPYNNIDINKDGFIYATIYATDLVSQMQSAITAKSKVGTYAPCKLLNPSGNEIMRRNGFWPPAGEVNFKGTVGTSGEKKSVSRVTDVACGPEGTWSIIDYNRNKIYTYDYEGNLLFAFGDSGSQLGNTSTIKAICYQGDNLLVLDGSTSSQRLTVFNRTEYGDALILALHHQNEREYNKAIDDWKEILMRNSNYDAAYVGIGKCLSREGKHEEALEYYQSAYDTENYSTSYKEMRKVWMSNFFLLIPIVIFAVCFGVVKFMQHAAKVNKKVAVSGKRGSFKDELYYVFHVMFHPIDGFWDLKHEKRGSVKAALVFMVLAVVALFYRSIGVGYVMNPQGQYTTIFMQILVVFVPILLFAVANWCITTLFEGEGSFKDIFIALGYSVLPIVFTSIPVTLLSNFAVAEETDILTLVITLGFIWTGLLIFFGMMVTHDYDMVKNIGTTVVTIVGMAFIMFLAILFTSLVMDMVSFVTSIVSEITYRL